MAGITANVTSVDEPVSGTAVRYIPIQRYYTAFSETFYIMLYTGSAGAGYGTTTSADFGPLNNDTYQRDTISFSIGQAIQLYPIHVVGGDADNGSETFTIVTEGSFSGNSTTLMTLTNPIPTLSIVETARANEGDTGTTLMSFTVTRSNLDGSPRATYTISNDPGDWPFPTDGSDFAFTGAYPQTGTVTFAAGSATATITVPIRGDHAFESPERFSVTLSDPIDATIATAVGIGTIVNDEVSGDLTLTGSTTSEGDAGNATATFTLSRTSGTGDVDLTIWPLGGTATLGVDYVDPGPIVLTLRNGAQSVSAMISIIGDGLAESNETIEVGGTSVFGLTSSILYGDPITIVNDDSSYAVGNANVGEGDLGGTRGLTFTVTRTGPTDFATTLYAQPVSGTATAGVDFADAVVPLSFLVSQTSATVTVPIVGDLSVEATESFTLNLYNANAGGTLSILRASATGGIVNDDVPLSTGPTIISGTPRHPSTLTGTAGDDIFLILNAGDTIVEGQNGGSDMVYSSISYALNGGAFVETLSTQNHRGTENIDLTGNFHAQQIIGNFGNNLLNGNGGTDTLVGLMGNDVYAIADPNAVIVESPGEGYDTVYTHVSYALTGTAEIEELSFTDQSGTGNLNLIGNGFSQKIIGNFGNNVINGNGGIDTLIGLKGDDIYVVGNAASVVVEAAGEGNDMVYATVSYALAAGASVETLSTQTHSDTTAINLKGNEIAQTVVGNNGANVIDGGAGADMLVGLGGADTFAFSTALGATNVDTIPDFGNGADKIQLSASVFTGLTAGALGAGSFVAGTAATAAAPQVIYDQATGRIFFDADGSGAGAAVLFANVAAGTTLTADMIAIV